MCKKTSIFANYINTLFIQSEPMITHSLLPLTYIPAVRPTGRITWGNGMFSWETVSSPAGRMAPLAPGIVFPALRIVFPALRIVFPALRIVFPALRIVFLAPGIVFLALRIVFLAPGIVFLALRIVFLALRIVFLALRIVFLAPGIVFLALRIVYPKRGRIKRSICRRVPIIFG
jgi:hypothetical protein